MTNKQNKRLMVPNNFRDIAWLERQLSERSESEWIRLGQKRALNLFHQMSKRVPAYKDFLKLNNVNPSKITSVKDFKKLPSIDKDNYLRKYSVSDLCWDGEFSHKSWVVSTTSGSTGKPFYFPRENTQDWQYAISAELYLRSNFQIHKKSTLYIVGFPMGAWIGGLFTYQALKLIADKKDYNLTIITPGIHKKEIIESVRQLGDQFDQVIIGSYAPFLKDILDEGEDEGLEWSKYNLGFIFSAEGFNELFRDYVAKKAGLKNVLVDTLNHYGTVDLGTMSHETPISILLRRATTDDVELAKSIFNIPERLPTLTQYNPAQFYFEEDDKRLYCSSYSGLPLVRYDLKDVGGVVRFEELQKRLARAGYDLRSEARSAKIEHTLWRLPFVYVYERDDFSVSFYAFQIYPETVKRAVIDPSLEAFITGKFTMEVVYEESGQQRLIVNIELKPDKEESEKLREHVRTLITELLITESSEYRETHSMYGEKVYPKIVFWPYEDASYFKSGGKQKWVKKK